MQFTFCLVGQIIMLVEDNYGLDTPPSHLGFILLLHLREKSIPPPKNPTKEKRKKKI